MNRRDFLRKSGTGILGGAAVAAIPAHVTAPTVPVEIPEPAETRNRWLLIAQFEVTEGFIRCLTELFGVNLNRMPPAGNVPIKFKPQTFKRGGGEIYIYNPGLLVPGATFIGKVQKRHTGGHTGEGGGEYKRIILKPSAYEPGGGIPYTDVEFACKVARYFHSCEGSVEEIKSFFEK